MALATQCPHCQTIFRVAADQLKLRGGIVRCGKCSSVFDGNATLIELDGVKAGETPPPAPSVPLVNPTSDTNEVPIYTLDFDMTFDPFGILPKSADEAQLAPDEQRLAEESRFA